jgi:hypothetical protein
MEPGSGALVSSLSPLVDRFGSVLLFVECDGAFDGGRITLAGTKAGLGFRGPGALFTGAEGALLEVWLSTRER